MAENGEFGRTIVSFIVLERNRLRFCYVFIIMLVPVYIHFNAGDESLAMWWLSYAIISGLIPMVIGAYLVFPAQV